jgi:hypothetical protein
MGNSFLYSKDSQIHSRFRNPFGFFMNSHIIELAVACIQQHFGAGEEGFILQIFPSQSHNAQ